MRNLAFIIMAFSFFSSASQADELELGSPAPEIVSTDHEGQPIDLGEALGSGTALVFFYPKAMTPGCTRQACSLRDGWDELQSREVTVFGVSSDAAETQAEFRDKHRIPFTLIADRDKKVADAFGKGRWSRQAYLFQDGKLVWRDLSASTSGQLEDVIEALDKLSENEDGV
jgi:peroxiredoxin Q/BCP